MPEPLTDADIAEIEAIYGRGDTPVVGGAWIFELVAALRAERGRLAAVEALLDAGEARHRGGLGIAELRSALGGPQHSPGEASAPATPHGAAAGGVTPVEPVGWGALCSACDHESAGHRMRYPHRCMGCGCLGFVDEWPQRAPDPPRQEAAPQRHEATGPTLCECGAPTSNSIHRPEAAPMGADVFHQKVRDALPTYSPDPDGAD